MSANTVGIDVDVLGRALVMGTPGHDAARDVAIRLSAALETYAIVAPGVVTLIEILVRAGATPTWAAERARDLLGMCRVLDVGAEDIEEGLGNAGASDASPRVAVTAAAMVRHDIAHVVAFDAGFDLVPGLVRIDPTEIYELFDVLDRSG